MQYGFYYDDSRCTGCRTCMMACKDYHDLDDTIAYRKVYDLEGGSTWTDDDGTVRTDAFAYHLSIACNHCTSPACTGVCPTGAMHKDADTGIVSVNTKVCIGCGYCTMACPYHAPAISHVTSTSAKCDGCRDRVARGQRPICVEACPVRALEFDDIVELRKRHPGTVDAIAPMPAGTVTLPSIVITPCGCAREPGATDVHVTNMAENHYLRY